MTSGLTRGHGGHRPSANHFEPLISFPCRRRCPSVPSLARAHQAHTTHTPLEMSQAAYFDPAIQGPQERHPVSRATHLKPRIPQMLQPAESAETTRSQQVGQRHASGVRIAC